jgi:Methyltransferase domain
MKAVWHRLVNRNRRIIAEVRRRGAALVKTPAHDWSNVADFIPFDTTMKAAKDAGLSVGDYIDTVMSKTPGVTRLTIDNLVSIGVYSGAVNWVVEIGPGSGRYVEKTLSVCSPSKYEIYETATKWGSYVAEKFEVLLQPTDGHSLKATPSDSADVVQAFKVFTTIPFSKTSQYWLEMIRVTRQGGWVVFDAVTEPCLDTKSVELWANAGIDNGSHPALLPRSVALNYFKERGFSCLGSFVVPMSPGTCATFAFRKGSLDQCRPLPTQS